MMATATTWDWMPAHRGGLAGDVSDIVLSAPSIAGGVVTAGGSSSLAAGVWGAAAVPVVGAIVAGVTIGLMALLNRKGPKQKVATTQIVDSVEPYLAENRDGYFAGPRTRSSQAQALANFDAGWDYVRQNCGDATMGDPGKRCISERDRGGRWDWFALYRDPIVNDPGVQPDPASPGVVEAIFGGGPSSNSPVPLFLAMGLAVAALMLGGRS